MTIAELEDLWARSGMVVLRMERDMAEALRDTLMDAPHMSQDGADDIGWDDLVEGLTDVLEGGVADWHDGFDGSFTMEVE